MGRRTTNPKFVKKKWDIKPPSLAEQAAPNPDGAPKPLAMTDPYQAYEMARQAYLDGVSLRDIVDKTGFPDHKVRQWIFYGGGMRTDDEFQKKCWRDQRRELEGAKTRGVYLIDKERILNTLDKTLNLIDKGIEFFAGRENELDARSIKDFTVIASELHRMQALEGGKPTEILGKVKLTHKTVLERLKKADPFVNYVEKKEEPAKPEVSTSDDNKDPVIN